MSAISKAGSQTRHAYLLNCVKISLTRRWTWVVAALVLGALGGLAFSIAAALAVGLGVVTALVVALLIGLNSWQRHSDDVGAWVYLR